MNTKKKEKKLTYKNNNKNEMNYKNNKMMKTTYKKSTKNVDENIKHNLDRQKTKNERK